MAQIFQFDPPITRVQKLASRDPGALEVQVPDGLAKRVTDAALWAGKSPDQFIIDMLNAAFPQGEGAA